MSVLVPYSQEFAHYELGSEHPFKPERFTLAFELMHAYGLLCPDAEACGLPAHAHTFEPEPASDEDLLLVHDARYIETVREASREPHSFQPRAGIGPGDTPAFHRMHEAAALVCGATTAALLSVYEGRDHRSFSVAGGLHHAHRGHASGFCVYNDPAVAIAVLKRDHPGVRIAYVDIDAHHGDGVEIAFANDPDVLTISVHESGRYLFPGTGRVVDRGTGAARGSIINVPMPPYADDECYRMVVDDLIAPALSAFAPDVIVTQCGADAHHADPLTHLGLTLPGYARVVASIVDSADEICDGRICCTGGGGYGTYSVVPRAWTAVLALLVGTTLAEELPETWRDRSSAISGLPGPGLLSGDTYAPMPAITEQVRVEVAALVHRVADGSPLLIDG